MMNKSPVRTTSKSHRTDATPDPSAPIRPLTAPAPWNKPTHNPTAPQEKRYSLQQGNTKKAAKPAQPIFMKYIDF
jgi:hypothetical protein